MNDVEKVLSRATAEKVRQVNLQFTDLYGVAKSVTIPIHQLEGALRQGKWFDGSSIDGFTRIAESDMFLRPDPGTYAVVPWHEGEQRVARLICDVFTPDGQPFDGDPRGVLRRQLAKAEQLGYVYNTGPELEFFLLKQTPEGKLVPLPHDTASYFDLAPDEGFDIRREMVANVEAMGLKVESSSHEVAPGQHEIDFEYSDALTTADRALTLKTALKATAKKHGLIATFMPKPIQGINGSGMHVHQSLASRETGKNLFYDAGDKYKLSSLARYFIGGQIKHLRSLSAVLGPTVNSYKRLVPGYEAPVYICWGQVNRSALIRIPRHAAGRGEGARCELRCPDPSCNPYLAFAVLLAAGLDGIKNKIEPPAPVEENVYHFDDAKLRELNIATLPHTLGEAVAELEKSSLAKEALGPHCFPELIRGLRAQWDEYRQSVSTWELDKYLSV